MPDGPLLHDGRVGARIENEDHCQKELLDQELVVILDERLAPTNIAMTNCCSRSWIDECLGIASEAWETKRVKIEIKVNDRFVGFVAAKPLREWNTGYYAVSVYAKYRLRGNKKKANITIRKRAYCNRNE